VRDWLGQRLPAYMVPALCVTVDQLPRTVGGKIDRRLLPDPGNHRPSLGRSYEAPRTPAEQAVVEVWQEVLQLDRIGVHDNFFDLGGHSLLATRAVIRLRAVFGVDVGVRTLFERPTVAGLADSVEEQLVGQIAEMSAEDVERALREQGVVQDVEQVVRERDLVQDVEQVLQEQELAQEVEEALREQALTEDVAPALQAAQEPADDVERAPGEQDRVEKEQQA
ncbi:phosphopantetheine-binding protein, partial [Streptomyces massasporeus]|uniref:phosphopantetheine-binding protein n=1 Tax=Streptomyces massasporeus TaxID=67324 RepID=UPI0033E9ACC0